MVPTIVSTVSAVSKAAEPLWGRHEALEFVEPGSKDIRAHVRLILRNSLSFMNSCELLRSGGHHS